MNRRRFIQTTGGLTFAGTKGLSFAKETGDQSVHFPKGKAEHCIHIWLGGGAAQVDTWDPKALGDAKAKKAGSYYPVIDTVMPGVQVCEHLSGCAKAMNHITAVRTVNHDVIDEHAAASNRMHTGRNVSGTTVYPSLGSIVAAERGAAHFRRVVQQRGVPEDVPEREIQLEGQASLSLLDALTTHLEWVASRSEARRLASQGAMEVDGERVADPNQPLVAGNYLIRVGKRRFLRLTVHP